MSDSNDSTNVSDEQITALRQEAAQAGDLAQVHICSVALGDEDPVTTADAFETRYGGGGFDAAETRAMMAVGSAAEARAYCAQIITDAAAMDDGGALGGGRR